MSKIKKLKIITFISVIHFGFTTPAFSNWAGPKGGAADAITSGIGDAVGLASGAAKSFVSNIAGIASNAGMGSMFQGMCSSKNYAACAIAASLFMQLVKNADGASNADKVHNDATNFDNSLFTDQINGALKQVGNDVGAQDDGQYGAQEGQMTRLSDWAKEKLGELEAKGVKVNEDGTISTPKGNVSASSLGSGAAMSDAGLIDETEIVIMDEAIKKAQARASKYGNMMVAAGGGGGYGGGAQRGVASVSDANGFRMNFNMGDKNSTKKGTAGLTRMVAGEPIGAKTGNLFDMVHRTYKRKADSQEFVK